MHSLLDSFIGFFTSIPGMLITGFSDLMKGITDAVSNLVPGFVKNIFGGGKDEKKDADVKNAKDANATPTNTNNQVKVEPAKRSEITVSKDPAPSTINSPSAVKAGGDEYTPVADQSGAKQKIVGDAGGKVRNGVRSRHLGGPCNQSPDAGELWRVP